MTRRYRVQVSRPEIHFIDAETPEQAIETAITLAQSRTPPTHYMSPTAHIDVVADVLDGEPV